MGKKDDLKSVKEDYDKLKEQNKLNVRSYKSRNIMESPIMSVVKICWENHVQDNKTIVPIDIIKSAESAGITLDFNHLKDKFRRGFEIYAISQLYPDELSSVRGFYGTQTTEILRKHFVMGKHFKMESNTELNKCFLSVDLSDLSVTESERVE